jgi:DNA polymerase III delta subunit
VIIFLYGPDAYHRQKKLKEIISQYQKKNSSLTSGDFDLEEENDWPRLKDFLTAGSLFGEKKLIVIRNPFAVSEKKDLKKLLQDSVTDKNNNLLISSIEAPLKDFAFLKNSPVIAQEFKFLTGANWKKFIDQEIKNRKLKTNASDYKFLLENYEGDCLALINELEKMSLSNGKIFSDGQSFQYQFFNLIRELANSNLNKKLMALEFLLENEDSAKIFNLLSSFSRNKKNVFADYDICVKSGKLEYEEVLLDYAIT